MALPLWRDDDERLLDLLVVGYLLLLRSSFLDDLRRSVDLLRRELVLCVHLPDLRLARADLRLGLAGELPAEDEHELEELLRWSESEPELVKDDEALEWVSSSEEQEESASQVEHEELEDPEEQVEQVDESES